MQHTQIISKFSALTVMSAFMLLGTGLATGAELGTKTFGEGKKGKLQGVILSRDGDMLKLRGNDNSIGIVDLTANTKVELKRGTFRHSGMNVGSLVPGFYVEARGKGNGRGDLVANRVVVNWNAVRVARQAEALVEPVEARTEALEAGAGQMESRAEQLEARAGQLEDQEKHTQQDVGQVKTELGQVKTAAGQANQGVEDLNDRVTSLDTYQPAYSEAVYFSVNSARLTPEGKQKLDNIAQEAKSEKGYAVEVLGYADKSGSAGYNQQLSNARTHAVVDYLLQEGDVPVQRILMPAGMSTSHPAADNSTSAGRKLNRRVEVKVLVNQGIAEASNQTAAVR